MNQVVTTTPRAALPAHLQRLAADPRLMAVNQQAAAGISAGGWPRISIKASRFRLVQADRQELVVPHLHLDVVIVDANPHGLSKRMYGGKYTEGSDDAPICWSDNGVGPSSKVAKPCAATCAVCPNNVWGSKISEASGAAIKACADLKKVAVLIADNTSGPVFELDIPAKSLKNFAVYMQKLEKHGIPASTLITRLTFDPSASHPMLMFDAAWLESGAIPYITEDMAADVMDVIDSEEVDQCTGKNDKPIDPARYQPQTGGVAGAVTNPTAEKVGNLPPLPQPVHTPPQPQGFAPQPQGFAPQPQPQAAFTPPPPPAATGFSAQAANPPAAEATGEKKTRRRRAAAEPAAPQPAAPAGGFSAPLPPQPAMAPSTAATNVPLQPSGVTNAALDDLIAKAMKA